MFKTKKDFLHTTKTLSVKSLKDSLPLMIAVFLLSIFAGIILNIVIRQWFASNTKLIKQIQAKEESQRLDFLLEKFSTF